jgi:hypothetical protein
MVGLASPPEHIGHRQMKLRPAGPPKPAGRVVKFRRGDPFPNWAATLFGPFGCLDESILRTIHAEERWYGDGEPCWKNAPTAEDARRKALTVAARLKHRNYVGLAGAAALALIIASCIDGNRCGSHACPMCGRVSQKWLVDAFRKLIRKSRNGYQDFTFNFVMPEGQTAICALESAPFDRILAKVRTALSECTAVEFAAFGIDTSANDDTAKFKSGRLKFGRRRYFQVHVYGLVRTNNRRAVWDALRHLFKSAANIYRPLTISPKPFDGSPNGLSYICKPDAFKHSPYLDKTGNWNTRKKHEAITASHHVRYLLAMHNLGFARRIALVGLHPEITKPTKTRNRGVRLRRVVRGGRAV